MISCFNLIVKLPHDLIEKIDTGQLSSWKSVNILQLESKNKKGVENFFCERTHTKSYMALFCQNKCLTQSEAKVLCELAISYFQFYAKYLCNLVKF